MSSPASLVTPKSPAMLSHNPDTGRGATVRAVLYFLASTPFLVILALGLHFSGVLTLDRVTELIHGKKAEVVAANPPEKGVPKLDLPPPSIGPAPGSAAVEDRTSPPIGPAPGGKQDRTSPLPRTNPVPSPTPPIPVNQPPVVTAEARLAFGRGDRSKAVEVRVQDEGAPTRLRVDVRSLDEALVPAAGLRWDGGSGPTRVLTVVPAPGKWGEAAVRVTATDPEGLTGETIIRVAVPPPGFTLTEIPNVTVKRGEPPVPVTLSVVDDSPVPGKVTFTALAAGPVLKADGVQVENGRLALAPVKGVTGSATVTVIAATADGREDRKTFTLTVNLPPVMPGGKARVRLRGVQATTAVYSNEAGTDSLLGLPAGGLATGTLVDVHAVGARNTQITWTDAGQTLTGWVENGILVGE